MSFMQLALWKYGVPLHTICVYGKNDLAFSLKSLTIIVNFRGRNLTLENQDNQEIPTLQ